MCKWKKFLVVGLIVVGVVFLARNTWVGSHVRLWWQQVSENVKQSVPPERELERLRMELDGLKAEDDRLVDRLAKQEISARKLEAEIADQRKALQEQEAELKQLHQALEQDASASFVVLHGERFSRDLAEKQLKTDFAAFERAEEHLKSREAHLAELNKAVRLGHTHRRELHLQRQQMATELQRLETALEEDKLARAQQEAGSDQGHQKVQADIESLKERIEALHRARELKKELGDSPIKAARERQQQDERLKSRLKLRLSNSETAIIVDE